MCYQSQIYVSVAYWTPSPPHTTDNPLCKNTDLNIFDYIYIYYAVIWITYHIDYPTKLTKIFHKYQKLKEIYLKLNDV